MSCMSKKSPPIDRDGSDAPMADWKNSPSAAALGQERALDFGGDAQFVFDACAFSSVAR